MSKIKRTLAFVGNDPWTSRLLYHPKARFSVADVRAMSPLEIVQHHAYLDVVDEATSEEIEKMQRTTSK